MRVPSVETPPNAPRALFRATKRGYIVLTRKGKPIAYLLPTQFYDEEDIGYMTDPKFWKLIDERRNDPRPGIPLEEIERELQERERKERAKARSNSRNGKKGKRNGTA